ncbi:MAG: diguanylate cyclase (GGDEF)-like protein [Candidatus Azotimanducaceae bacterium]|jgi:diguanylate cyclase (GGDEF)-like protein
MDFEIARGNKTRTFYLIGTNLLLTVGLTILIYVMGTQNSTINFVDLIFEAASGFVAFVLFCTAAVVRVAGARMNWLLLGLFLYQCGAALDAMDEVVSFAFSFWSVTGDLLALVGELTLAAVAYNFVILTLNIANTDRLTELMNRSYHERWVDDYLDRNNHPLAIVAIDMDNFKKINDEHGHAFGDKVLRHIGQLLKGFMRSRRGIASRTGGEEFEIALKNATEVETLEVAEELRQLIELNPPAGLERLTASVGVAISKKKESTYALRKRADGAAYFSKQSGRNRVSLAGKNQTINNITPVTQNEHP